MTSTIRKLGDVLQISRGGSPRPIEDYITDDKNGLNWIKIGDVEVGAKYITKTKEKIRKEGLSKTRQVKAGDFLLSNSMSFGRPYITKIDGCIHDGWLSLRDDEKIFNTDFLYHVLSSNAVKEQFRKYASGAVVKNLNIDAVSKVVIEIPQLAEQQRIANLLDTADHIMRLRETTIEKLEVIIRSFFNYQIQKNKNKFIQTELGKVVELKYGKSLPAQTRNNGIYKVYGSNGVVGVHDQAFTCGETIIVGRKGSYGEINLSLEKCFPIDTTYYIDQSATKQNLIWLRYALENLNLNTLNKSAAVPGLNREDAYRQPMLLASAELQSEFEVFVRDVWKNIRLHKELLVKQKMLTAALQHQSFSVN
jgi:restriction endonuclease S subunit